MRWVARKKPTPLFSGSSGDSGGTTSATEGWVGADMRPGRRAEELVEWGCRRLADAGVAFVRKTEPAMRITRAGGKIIGAAPEASAPPDFLGFTRSRGVCFDVKQARDDGSWTWTERRILTKMRQVADITRAGGEFGAVAGLLIVFFGTPNHPGDRAVWIPWWHIQAVENGRWTADRLLGLAGPAQGIPEPTGMGISWPAGGDPDWLAAALKAEQVRV